MSRQLPPRGSTFQTNFCPVLSLSLSLSLSSSFFELRKPDINFKDGSTPLYISLRFTCPFLATCICCSKTNEEKTEYQRVHGRLPMCPYSRKVVFLDSLTQIGFGLNNMIKDLGEAASKMNISQAEIFPSVSKHLRALDFSEEQLNMVLGAKIPFPFEAISSIEYLQSMVEPPPREHFASVLRAEPILPENEYQDFCTLWNVLKIETLYQFFLLYIQLDTLFLLDCLYFYFEEIYRITSIFPSHLNTISSVALRGALRSARDPEKPERSIRIELLSQPVYDVFKEMLIGISNNISFN